MERSTSGVELVEACAVPVTADAAPITLSAFDPSEELVWSASGSGMIYSHCVPSIELYSAFRADVHGAPALGLFPNPFGLVALTHDAVRFFSKGGVSHGDIVRCASPRLSPLLLLSFAPLPASLHPAHPSPLRLSQVRPELSGAACGCLLASSASTQLAVAAFGNDNPSLSLLDLNTTQITASLKLEAPATLARLEPHSSLVCLSGAGTRQTLAPHLTRPTRPTRLARDALSVRATALAKIRRRHREHVRRARRREGRGQVPSLPRQVTDGLCDGRCRE